MRPEEVSCIIFLLTHTLQLRWHLPWERLILSHHEKDDILPTAGCKTGLLEFFWNNSLNKQNFMQY